METVTNIASAASRAIWGEGTNPEDRKDANGNETLGKEPISGELGDVKSGEPYDKGNVDAEHSTTLPAKSTLTSNSKPTATEPTDDASAGAVLLPESEVSSRDTPTNLLATSDKPSAASQRLPSETSEGEPLTFTKSDPAAATKNGSYGEATPGMESLEEKARNVPGTTGFGSQKSESATGTSTSATKSEGLREESVGSTGLLEEKRINPESASEPKIGETTTATTNTPHSGSDIKSTDSKKSLDGTGSGDGGEKEKKSLKEKIKEKLHRHKD